MRLGNKFSVKALITPLRVATLPREIFITSVACSVQWPGVVHRLVVAVVELLLIIDKKFCCEYELHLPHGCDVG